MTPYMISWAATFSRAPCGRCGSARERRGRAPPSLRAGDADEIRDRQRRAVQDDGHSKTPLAPAVGPAEPSGIMRRAGRSLPRRSPAAGRVPGSAPQSPSARGAQGDVMRMVPVVRELEADLAAESEEHPGGGLLSRISAARSPGAGEDLAALVDPADLSPGRAARRRGPSPESSGARRSSSSRAPRRRSRSRSGRRRSGRGRGSVRHQARLRAEGDNVGRTPVEQLFADTLELEPVKEVEELAPAPTSAPPRARIFSVARFHRGPPPFRPPWTSPFRSSVASRYVAVHLEELARDDSALVHHDG